MWGIEMFWVSFGFFLISNHLLLVFWSNLLVRFPICLAFLANVQLINRMY